jgi:hypothetical protein
MVNSIAPGDAGTHMVLVSGTGPSVLSSGALLTVIDPAITSNQTDVSWTLLPVSQAVNNGTNTVTLPVDSVTERQQPAQPACGGQRQHGRFGHRADGQIHRQRGVKSGYFGLISSGVEVRKINRNDRGLGSGIVEQLVTRA